MAFRMPAEELKKIVFYVTHEGAGPSICAEGETKPHSLETAARQSPLGGNDVVSPEAFVF